MSRRASCKRVSFRPNQEATEEPMFTINESLSSSHHDRRRVVLVGILSFGLRSSPAARKLLRRIGARVVKTLRFMSLGRSTTESSSKVSSSLLLSSSSSSSSSSSIYMKRSKSLSESESHRAEAIEDCIKFLNSSSSSLFRSNSVSTWSS